MKSRLQSLWKNICKRENVIALVSALVTVVAVAFIYEAFFTEKTDQSMKVGFV